MARIDWSKPAFRIDCEIRGLTPFPGAWFEFDGQRIKVLDAKVGDGSGRPGEVLDDRLTVACGEGALSILRLQRAGKSPADVDVFLRGRSIPQGTLLPVAGDA